MHIPASPPRIAILLAGGALALAAAPLLACGDIEIGDLDETPAAAPAQAPVAAPAPSAAASAWDEHCGTPETAVFNCMADEPNEIVVCGSSFDDPWLRVRYGTFSAPQILHPDSPEGVMEQFKLEERSYIRSQGPALVFERDGMTYELVEMAGGGGGPDASANNFAGIYVRKGEDLVRQISCTSEPNSDWNAIRAILDPISP